MVKLVLYEEACRCTVTFESGRFRQDVWSKKSWEEAPKGVKTKKPTVLSQEQGQAVQNSIMSQYMGIDNSLKAEYNLLRKKENIGVFSKLPEPMQMRHINSILRDLGIEKNGIEFDIIRDEDLIGKGVYGYTFPNGKRVQLYPDAFSSREELVKTLGHERIHCNQIYLFGEAKTIDELKEYERAAKFSEDYWWSIYKERTGYNENK